MKQPNLFGEEQPLPPETKTPKQKSIDPIDQEALSLAAQAIKTDILIKENTLTWEASAAYHDGANPRGRIFRATGPSQDQAVHSQIRKIQTSLYWKSYLKNVKGQ